MFSTTTTGNTYNYMKLGAQQGWQCPLCNRIFGPFVQECLYCKKKEYTLTSTAKDR